MFFGIAVVAIAFVWHGATKKDDSAQKEISPKPVKTEVITTTSFEPTESFSGFVSGTNHTTVAPKMPGYVIALLKEPGDTVQAGETIAILDGSALTAQSESAVESLKSAVETFEKTEKYLNQTVDEAKSHLNKTKESRESGDATSKDVRIAEEAVESAKKMRDAKIAEAQSTVVSARGGSAVSGAIAQDRFVKAPFGGMVTKKLTSFGSYVGPGSALYEIASTSEREISISVPANLAVALKKGTPVTIKAEHSKDILEGTIFSVAHAVDKNTGETLVRVRPKNSENPLLIGQYATVTFPSATERSALLIPESSVSRVYDHTFVFIAQDNTAVQKSVTLGDRSGDRIEILSGLDDGDTLITEGMYGLRNEAKVTTK